MGLFVYFDFLFTQKILSKNISYVEFFSVLLGDILQPFPRTFHLVSHKVVPSGGQRDAICISHQQYF